ncbi:sigma-70 family RNA polymerase sigma factor [Cytobacillus sp.]|uniref:RNA polymerase sigma factor n=1 Tax=Cytobacillus sp. TaxID=2675269 RepID=UPI0028BF37D8|nr:sigma-70 family RNA polymerase sigma factor [Cytobacillus sp.]
MLHENDVFLAQSGDQEAFIRLINSCESSLYRVAKGFLKKDSDCADAIQETILKSYKSISRLKNPAYFKSWLIRILINECNDLLRANQKSFPLETIENIADSSVNNFEELRDALIQLNEKYRTVVGLFYFEGCSIKEIAEILTIREGTVKSRLNRARSMLASFINQMKEERGSQHG